MAEAEKLGSGGPGAADAEHVDLFIANSGLQNGAVGFELARDILVFFYTELYSEMCASSDGPKVMGLQLLAANQKLDQILAINSAAGEPVGESYSVRPELDTVKCASTTEDREAEIQLDLIRQLVDRRQGRAALQLLADLQPKVDRGALSTLVRARFFINKGVCHLVCDEQQLAVQEFERARVLDPMNPKALINLAQVALLRKNYDQALELANRVLEFSPKDVNTFSVQLACLHQLARKDELDTLIASNRWLLEEQSCLYTIAYIAFDEHRFDEAEHYLRRHNEKDSKYAEAWNLLGSAILVPAQQQIQDRAAAPNLVPAELRPRLEEAEECFSRAEQLLTSCDSRRELARTYANRGVSRMFLSKFDDGRRDFERALDIDPSSDEVRRNLGSLFLYAGKAEEAIRVFEQVSNQQVRESLTLQLAAAYLDSDRPAEARRTVETALQSGVPRDAVLLIDLFLIACHRLREIEPAEARIEQLEAAAIEVPDANRVLGQHWFRLGETPKAVAAIRRAIDIAPETRKPRYRLILAEMHYRLMRYADAADEYERVPVVVDRSDDTRRYVAALYAAGRFAKALQWTRAVRGQLPAVPDFSEIEALVVERSGDLKAANVLRQALLADEVAASRQRLKIGANLIRLGQNAAARPLIEKVTLGEIENDAELLLEAARLRTILEMPDALKFAYRLLRLEFSNPETHLFYTSTFFRREKVDEALFHPTAIELDCTVLLRHGNETQRYTIIEGEGDTATNHISSSHPLAVILLGRTVGEKFRYPTNSPAEAEYEIQQVQSKYVFAFQDCLSHFNERFPAHEGLSRMEINPADPTNIVMMLESQRARSEKIFEMYCAGSLPACTIARLLGRSDVDLFRRLVSESSIRVLSSSASGAELQQELQRLRTATTVLVESSALVTLETLGLLPKLNERFTSVRVTQQTLDAIAETVLNINPEKRTGHISSDTPGHIQLIEHTATEMNAEKEFYQRIEQFLRSSVQVIAPDVGPALGEYERMDVRTTLGAAAASTVAAARGAGILVYSDDLALRLVARNGQKVGSFWTQTLLQDFREKGLMSPDEYHRAVAQLIESGFHFVSVNSADLVWAIRETSWTPSLRVSKIVATLAGPDCSLNDAVNVALEVLHELWDDPVPRATKLAFLDMIIQVLVTGRNGTAVLTALSSRNAARSLIWTSATNEIQQSIRLWLFARSKGLVSNRSQRFIGGNQN
jgi:tetratricopeptide (TPR) repeat protein